MMSQLMSKFMRALKAVVGKGAKAFGNPPLVAFLALITLSLVLMLVSCVLQKESEGCTTVRLSSIPEEIPTFTPMSQESPPSTTVEENAATDTPPKPLAQGGGPLSEVETVRMPAVDVQKLLAEDEQRGKEAPLRFAKPIEVEITAETHGTWETLDDGTLLWRLRIQSPGAVSLNLGFTTYFMPPGGRLFLYTPDYSTVVGPFTDQDNEEHRQLWTPILEGDEIVVEVQLPSDALSKLELELTSVNHGYKECGR
jgi:hypothetical protein